MSVVGALLLRAVAIRQVTRETKLMAAGVAGVLAAIDVNFVVRDVIPSIDLLDAAIEGGLVTAWILRYVRNELANSHP